MNTRPGFARGAVAGVFVALAACGGRSPLDLAGGAAGAAGSTDDSSLATPTAFCLALDSHSRAPLARCYGAQPPAAAIAAYDDGVCQSLDASLAAGRITYDRASAAACLAQVDATYAASCRFEQVPCLDEVVAGVVADGAPCTSSADCGTTSNCLRPDPTTCDVTVCMPAAALGAPCGVECAPGLTCSDDAANVCVLDTGLANAPCDPTAVTPCDWGFSCRSNGDGSGTCREAKAGDACAGDLECPQEDFCDGTCKARLPIGATCAITPQGCVALATCDPVAGRCIAAGASGQPCGENGFCYDGVCTTAFTATPVCLADLPTGASCDTPAECASGVCSPSGTCVACAP